MQVYDWEQDGVVPEIADGDAGGRIERCLDLTALHGETELLRQGRLVDVDGDGASSWWRAPSTPTGRAPCG